MGAAIFVWCENASTNDGENPEITIPKSAVWTSKCEVRNLKSEDTSRFPYVLDTTLCDITFVSDLR
jgi:hypothetical protein